MSGGPGSRTYQPQDHAADSGGHTTSAQSWPLLPCLPSAAFFGTTAG